MITHTRILDDKAKDLLDDFLNGPVDPRTTKDNSSKILLLANQDNVIPNEEVKKTSPILKSDLINNIKSLS